LWFFHQGEPLEIVFIKEGVLNTIILGNSFENGQVPQATIPANTWFASRVKDQKGYALVSCTVAPGFDFADFELATREKLSQEFPHLKEIIQKFTKA
jgi:predicted cupin superfamily sugar epimerase